MQNVDLFNSFVLQVFDHLYDHFPVPCSLDPTNFVTKVELSPYPHRPVSTYCGPDMTWVFPSDTEEVAKLWAGHSWENTTAEVESLLGRSLTDDERDVLRRTGRRPVTANEQLLLENWEAEKARIDSLRASEQVQLQEAKTKHAIFLATLQFLTNEKLIRFVDLPPPAQGGQILNPPDVLIEKAIGRLRFVLTSSGFSHLNRAFMEGKLSGEMTLYQAIKRTLKEKATEGANAVGVQALVGWILS